MSVVKKNQLAAKTARNTFAEARVTLSEAAEISGLSLNTVKRVLQGEGAHENSCLQVERSLRDYIRRGYKKAENVVSLEGEAGKVAVNLMTNLADTLHDQVKSQDPLQGSQLKKLKSLLIVVTASLTALDALNVEDT